MNALYVKFINEYENLKSNEELVDIIKKYKILIKTIPLDMEFIIDKLLDNENSLLVLSYAFYKNACNTLRTLNVLIPGKTYEEMKEMTKST